MCDLYSSAKFDITTKGRKGWKIILNDGGVMRTGPFRGTTLEPGGWMEAHYNTRYRLGFHGFCFFFDREEAASYLGCIFWSREIVPIRVRGRVKRAKVEGIYCYLAEYIKFEEVPKVEVP